MGFFDVLLGRRKLAKPAPDRLFAMTTAAITLQTDYNLTSTNKAALVFQPLATADFDRIVKEMEELLRGLSSEGDTPIQIDREDDSFGYRWMILTDKNFDDLVVGLNAVSSELQSGGYDDRILCAVFPFKSEKGESVYWIYNFKRGKFYAFVPAPGDNQRNSERELQFKAQMESELPFEDDLSRWFPLWSIPI